MNVIRKQKVSMFLVVLFLGTINLSEAQTPDVRYEKGTPSGTDEKQVINLLSNPTPNALIISDDPIYEGEWKGDHGIEFTVEDQTTISKFKITFTFSGNCSGSITIGSSSISIKDRQFTIRYNNSFLGTSGSLSGTFSEDGKHCSGNFSYSDPPCQTSGSWSAELGEGGGEVTESEPNDTPEEAQQLLGSSPFVVTGNVEVSDNGALTIRFQDETTDDIEDLFVITTESVGLNVALMEASSDLDLYLIDESVSVIKSSLQSGVIDEEIDMPDLSVGTYYIGVSIYDPAPGGPNSSPYILTVTSDGNFVTSVEDQIAGLHKAFELKQNYPNPFSASTTIQFDVFKSSQIIIKIYDILGREVKTLVDQKYHPGSHAVVWNGADDKGLLVASGRYLVRMQADEFVTVKKMLMLK